MIFHYLLFYLFLFFRILINYLLKRINFIILLLFYYFIIILLFYYYFIIILLFYYYFIILLLFYYFIIILLLFYYFLSNSNLFLAISLTYISGSLVEMLSKTLELTIFLQAASRIFASSSF